MYSLDALHGILRPTLFTVKLILLKCCWGPKECVGPVVRQCTTTTITMATYVSTEIMVAIVYQSYYYCMESSLIYYLGHAVVAFDHQRRVDHCCNNSRICVL